MNIGPKIFDGNVCAMQENALGIEKYSKKKKISLLMNIIFGGESVFFFKSYKLPFYRWTHNTIYLANNTFSIHELYK